VNEKGIKIAEKIHGLFKRRHMTLSVAESCTGGLVSHYITSLPGASIFFTGAIVSYSEAFKKRALGVSQETIDRHGVISLETAREMAEGVRALSHSNYSVATTGNLGPDVLEGKEQGLVYIASCGPDGCVSRELRLAGSREENKEASAVEALKLLVALVEGQGS
jgi:PncC family amidohydrolase